MSGVSVVIITHNEEANLPRCLASVSWADEIIVVDADSQDRTCDIARSAGASVITVPWRGFGHAKQAGVARASGDWILSLDADEELTPELADEIRAATSANGTMSAYTLPRRTNFLGRWISHSNWYPDEVLRLFRRGRGRFDEALVHERLIVDGPIGRLSTELRHYSYPSFELYLEKFNRYTSLAARDAYERGERTRWSDLTVRPLASFLKHFFTKRGFLDGWEGFIISVMSSCSVFVKFVKLRHLARTAGRGPS